VLRLSTRAAMYTLLMTGHYPWFDLGNAHPITITFDRQERQNRLWGIPLLGILVRWILLIPHFLILAILGIGVAILALLSWIFVLVSGRQADGLVAFTAGVYRWSVRVSAYATLLTGRYPPFRLTP
jgi:hypothetical protein